MEELSDMSLPLGIFQTLQSCLLASYLSEVFLIHDLVWCWLCWLCWDFALSSPVGLGLTSPKTITKDLNSGSAHANGL